MSLLDDAYDVKQPCGYAVAYRYSYYDNNKKEILPMEYEGMSALQVLEDIKTELQEVYHKYGSIKTRIESEARGIKMMLNNIEEFIEYNNDNNISKADPSKCLHINKKISDNGHAETVLCADCGLMLSYKVL